MKEYTNKELYEMWELNRKVMTKQKFADMVGLSFSTVNTKLYRGRAKAKQYELKHNLFAVDFGSPWELTGDAVVVGDVHVPATDIEFAMFPAKIAEKHLKSGSRKLIVAGDLFSFDSISSYAKLPGQAMLKQELAAAKELILTWRKVFDEIFILMGNHDVRIIRTMAGEIDAEELLQLVSKDTNVRWSNFGYTTLTSADIPYRITHSTNYSCNQLTIADTLAQKFHSNIISHHEHHLALGYDRYKRFLVINNGGLFDQQKMAYTQMQDNTMPNMIPGFTMVRNGYAYLFGKSLTNWEDWL